MQFNITHLNPVRVLQTAYLHAVSKGEYGTNHHWELLQQGKAANWLSEEKCKSLLKYKRSDFYIDDHNGKPLKLGWKKEKDGRILLDATMYDLYQGKYLLLEALLFMFDHNDIMITKKDDLNLNEAYPIDENSRISAPEMERLMNYLVAIEDVENGQHYRIDTQAAMKAPEPMG